MADDAVSVLEHFPGKWEVLGALLPNRRQNVIDDAVREQPADHAGISLHRVDVPTRVAAPDRQARNEVVQHEVVQDDQPGASPERVHDPRMGLRTVSHVVEGDVRPSR